MNLKFHLLKDDPHGWKYPILLSFNFYYLIIVAIFFTRVIIQYLHWHRKWISTRRIVMVKWLQISMISRFIKTWYWHPLSKHVSKQTCISQWMTSHSISTIFLSHNNGQLAFYNHLPPLRLSLLVPVQAVRMSMDISKVLRFTIW